MQYLQFQDVRKNTSHMKGHDPNAEKSVHVHLAIQDVTL